MFADLEEISVLSQEESGDISNGQLPCPKQNMSGICPDKLVWATARLGKTWILFLAHSVSSTTKICCRFIERG